MKNYLVTNIEFYNPKLDIVFSSITQLDGFEFPADIDGIQAWLVDYNHNVTNSEAYAAWLRSVLFYNWRLTYDFKETDMTIDNTEAGLWLADLADFQYKETVSKPVLVSMPSYIVVQIDETDPVNIIDGIEQAIFEQLIEHLRLTIKVN